MVATWLLLVSAGTLSWGVGQIFAKRCTVKMGYMRMVLLFLILDPLFYSIWWYMGREQSNLTLLGSVAALIAAYTGILGYAMYFASLEHGQVSIVGTIAAAYPVVTVAIAIGLGIDKLSLLQAVGIAALIASVILLWKEEKARSSSLTRRAFALAFATFFLWGLWGIFTNAAVDDLGWGNTFGFYSVANITVLGLVIPYWGKRRNDDVPAGQDWWLYSIGTILFLAAGITASTAAYHSGTASLVTAVSGAYPAITAIISFAVLKEKFRSWQVLGILLFLFGIALVSVESV